MKNSQQYLQDLTDQIVDFIFAKGKTYKKDNTKYLRALGLQDVKNKLYLDASGFLVDNIDEYLYDKNVAEMEYYNKMSNFSTLKDSLNPHKPDVYSKYFVPEIDGKRTHQWNDFSELLEKDQFGMLHLINQSRSPSGIFHIGEKGSGKTLTQNVWLYENHELLEQNNIFWIRLDASKLDKLWETGQKRFVTTEQYLLGQMVYVFCKHFQSKFENNYSPLFGEIAKKLEQSPVNIIAEPTTTTKSDSIEHSQAEHFSYTADKQNRKTIIDYLSYFEEIISKHEQTYNGPNSRKNDWDKIQTQESFFITKILKEWCIKGEHQLYIQWYEIAKILRSFILENGYYLFYIIDGIDSIDFYAKGRNDRIKRMIMQLFAFPLMKTESVIGANELIMISLRDTTFATMLQIYSEMGYSGDPIYRDIRCFRPIRQDSKNLYKPIFDKRIDFMCTQIKVPDSCYMAKVLQCIKEHNIIKDERRWHSNFRCFLSNHLSLAKLITFKYYFAGCPDQFNIKEQILLLEEDNFLLNGEVFYSKHDTRSNNGDHCFNIFNTDSLNTNYTSYTRILLIVKAKNNISLCQILDIMSVFGSSASAPYMIEKLSSTGMIVPTFHPDSNTTFSITNKGEYVLELFFNHISFLYYCALDATLPIEIINQFRIAPNNYISIGQGERHFPACCIITGAIFLKFIIARNKSEIQGKKSALQKAMCDISNDILSLPIDKVKLSESIRLMLHAAKSEDLNIIQNWINN